MTAQQLDCIATLRRENYSYQFIGDTLGISVNTVKSICYRNNFVPNGRRKTKAEKRHAALCRNCHRPLSSASRKDAIFCSDYCRSEWRRKNRRIIEKHP